MKIDKNGPPVKMRALKPVTTLIYGSDRTGRQRTPGEEFDAYAEDADALEKGGYAERVMPSVKEAIKEAVAPKKEGGKKR